MSGGVTCSCVCPDHTCVHVVNNVLSYVKCYMARANPDSLMKVMDSSFTDEEMVTAKNMLWDVGGVPLLGKNLKRTGSENRTKRFILCTDVVEGMQKLDQSENSMPTFVCNADDLGRLPMYSPEELNVVTLDERCRKLERDMKTMQHQLTLRTDAWSKTEDQVDHLEVAVTQHAGHIRKLESGSNRPDVAEPDSHVNQLYSSILVANKKDLNVSSTTTVIEDKTPEPPQSEEVTEQLPVTTKGGDTIGTSSVVDSHQQESNDKQLPVKPSTSGVDGNAMLQDGFQYQKSYLDKLKKRQKVIQGTCSDGDVDFAAAEFVPLHKVFITQVRNDVTMDNVKLHMKRKNINFVGIYRKSRADYIHQSFVVSVKEDSYDKMFDATLWPPGVKLRDYNPIRRRNNNE